MPSPFSTSDLLCLGSKKAEFSIHLKRSFKYSIAEKRNGYKKG